MFSPLSYASGFDSNHLDYLQTFMCLMFADVYLALLELNGRHLVFASRAQAGESVYVPKEIGRPCAARTLELYFRSMAVIFQTLFQT